MTNNGFNGGGGSRVRLAFIAGLTFAVLALVWVAVFYVAAGLAHDQVDSLSDATAPAATPSMDIRFDCEEIERTAFRSAAERDWFESTCPQAQREVQPTPAPLPTAGPDRTDCNEIRGTAYRSPQERQFYLSNCIAN